MENHSEGYIIQLGGLSKSQVLREMNNILENGEVEKLTVAVSYKATSATKIEKRKNNLEIIRRSVLNQGSGKYEKRKSNIFKMMEEHEKVPTPFEEAVEDYDDGKYEIALEKLLKLEKQILEKSSFDDVSVKEDKQYSDVTFYIGNCYFKLKNYPQAIFYYEKNDGSDERQIGQRMNNLGTCFAMEQRHQLSLKAFNEALKIYSQHPEVDCSSLLNNIGLIYKKSGMFNIAEEYFLESINERQEKSPENERMIYQSYLEMGICQKELKKYDESINSMRFALNYAKNGGGSIITVLKEMAKIFEIQQKWIEALNYYQKLSDEYERENLTQIYIYERVSKIHETLGNYNTSMKFQKKAKQEEENSKKLTGFSSVRNVVF